MEHVSSQGITQNSLKRYLIQIHSMAYRELASLQKKNTEILLYVYILKMSFKKTKNWPLFPHITAKPEFVKTQFCINRWLLCKGYVWVDDVITIDVIAKRAKMTRFTVSFLNFMQLKSVFFKQKVLLISFLKEIYAKISTSIFILGWLVIELVFAYNKITIYKPRKISSDQFLLCTFQRLGRWELNCNY